MAEAGSTLELHVLALLRARNRAAAPALAVTKAATTLLTECTALEKQLDRERQATDLLVKEHGAAAPERGQWWSEPRAH